MHEWQVRVARVVVVQANHSRAVPLHPFTIGLVFQLYESRPTQAPGVRQSARYSLLASPVAQSRGDLVPALAEDATKSERDIRAGRCYAAGEGEGGLQKLFLRKEEQLRLVC